MRPEELTEIYESRELTATRLGRWPPTSVADPEKALEVHAREELGIDPNELGNPVLAAMSSFFAFALGAVLPLLPWFFGAATAPSWRRSSSG